jgi:uncharacterized protein
MLFGYSLATLAWIAAASLLAFIVRGVSGFGSSMIGIGALTLVLPPAQVVPAFLAIELLTSTHLLPSVWREIDWRSLRWVIAGCALATPLGVLLLGRVPADPMRAGVSACLLLIALFMLSARADRVAQAAPRSHAAAFAVGCGSGLLNGAAGIGGPPAIVFYFTAHAAAVGRASLIAYFVFTDVVSLAWAGATGLLHGAAWSLVIVALPFSLLGVWIGSRFYLGLAEADLRRWVWRLLALLGALGLASAAWRFFAAGF